MKALPLSVLAFVASCQTTIQGPDRYTFPKNFFVEQKLSIHGEGLKRETRAQLERKSGNYTLVLTDPMSGMVLAKVSMKKDESPSPDYIAPVISEQTLPLRDIGESIRFLYESPVMERQGKGFERRDPDNRWIYTWTTFAGGDACHFPKDLKLSFLKARYEMTIDLKHVECLP